jgi:hypothetical protein
MPLVRCRYCENEHGDLLLCQPAKRVLDALLERGQRFDMPTIEFPEAIGGPGMLGPGTVLVRQLVAKAAILPVADVPRPTLILTGQDLAGNVLPEWVYPAGAGDLNRAAKLVSDMVEMAVRRARQAGGG